MKLQIVLVLEEFPNLWHCGKGVWQNQITEDKELRPCNPEVSSWEWNRDKNQEFECRVATQESDLEKVK